MGAIAFSLDPQFATHLQEALPLRTLVETGTYEGDTIASVRGLFDSVHSVELLDVYYEAARERFSDDAGVQLYLGSSPEMLSALRAELARTSALYWLDAHWCVGDSTGPHDSQCPLLEELDAIGSLNEESVVLIDDARLFLATPPVPHDITNWPRFGEVLEQVLRIAPAHELTVVERRDRCISAGRTRGGHALRPYRRDRLARDDPPAASARRGTGGACDSSRGAPGHDQRAHSNRRGAQGTDRRAVRRGHALATVSKAF